jgi:hypothetical protein
MIKCVNAIHREYAIMSIFAKPVPQLDATDLQELLTDRAVENARLEFKREVPSKDETLKKLSSFANTFGGYMVVGASANSADGRIDGLPGVDEEAGYKQKIVDWCYSAVSPPITVEVSDSIPAPASPGKFCYIIVVPESDVAPHFLSGRKGVWIRTDEFSARFEARLADERELRVLFDRRKVILARRDHLIARSKKRFDTYYLKLHKDFGGSQTKSIACLEFCVIPRFPARPLCRQEALKSFVQKSWMNWRAGMFPDPSSPILSQHESAIVLQAVRDFSKSMSLFEVNIWGLLFYGVQIETNENGTMAIHLYRVVGCVLLLIQHARRMLAQFGYSGPVKIETKLASILNVKWLHGDNWGVAATVGSELDNDISFSLETTTDALRDKPDGVVSEIVRYILFSVNKADLVDTQQRLEEVIRMGYRFNSWTQPSTLKI